MPLYGKSYSSQSDGFKGRSTLNRFPSISFLSGRGLFMHTCLSRNEFKEPLDLSLTFDRKRFRYYRQNFKLVLNEGDFPLYLSQGDATEKVRNPTYKN